MKRDYFGLKGAPTSPNGNRNLGQDLGTSGQSSRIAFLKIRLENKRLPIVLGEERGAGRGLQPHVRPMAKNFSRRWRRTVSRSRPASSSRALAIASPVEAIAAAGSRWAPPGGSVTI